MRVTDLARRIKDDLRELLARTYPTSLEEWHQRIVPNYCPEFGTTYEDRLRYRVSQSVAEQLCRGLWDRIISRDKTVSCKALEEYQRLLPQFLEREPGHAAIEFALIAKQAASYLEYLSDKCGALMKDRGAPNTPGKKGKSTIWRYRFPLDVPKPPCAA